MVEMVVSFLLLIIFMSCTVAIVSSSMQIFARNISMSRAQSVSDLILSDVVGEIEKASSALEYNDHVIAFENQHGDREIIYVDSVSRQLNIHYDEYQNPKSGVVESQSVNWNYGSRNYMGNQIQEFTIRQLNAGENSRPVFEITLKLKNSQTQYEYQESRIAECYFEESALWKDNGNADSQTLRADGNILCDCHDNYIEINNEK